MLSTDSSQLTLCAYGCAVVVTMRPIRSTNARPSWTEGSALGFRDVGVARGKQIDGIHDIVCWNEVVVANNAVQKGQKNVEVTLAAEVVPIGILEGCFQVVAEVGLAAKNAGDEALHRGDGVLLVGASAAETREEIGQLYAFSLLFPASWPPRAEASTRRPQGSRSPKAHHCRFRRAIS